MTPSTTSTGRLSVTALVLGVLSAALITVVSFIALVLAVGALVTGGAALAARQRRAPAVAGMVLAAAAVALFVVEVAS